MLEEPGDARPEGVGAVRVFQQGKTVGRDRVVDLYPGTDTTTIRWRASFFPKVPGTGWITERGLRHFLEQCAHGLAEHAADASLFRS